VTPIGDAVNVAARRQALTKACGQVIKIGADTAEAVRERVRLRSICEVEIRGKSAPLDGYAVLGAREAPGQPAPAPN
jgi:class 3 adenylate cyclase